MRIISSLITLGFLAYGVYWIAENRPELKTKALEYFDQKSFHTLEARYTPKQIMDTQRFGILRNQKYKYLDPTLKFHPYLLMEVKFTTEGNKTGEGVILWDLIDGEMVINAKTWEKSHGFADCIHANAERHEFKIINLLAKKGGSIDRGGLIRSLQIENDILDAWLDSCRKKKLIVQSGNYYRLHLEDPKLNVLPSTFMDAPLVTKSSKQAECLSRRYSPHQVKHCAESAFGHDFAIRNTMDVFLPVYSVSIQNPDGSLRTILFNALNGQVLHGSSFID